MPPADRPQEPQSLADKLRAEHYEFAPTGYPSYCDGCGEAWPCAVSLVLDLLRATCQERDTLRPALERLVGALTEALWPIESSDLASALVNARALLRGVPANRRTKAMCSACGLADWPCPSLDCPGVPANPGGEL